MESHVNLSTDMAVTHAKEFLSRMSAPQKIEQQVGKILLSVDDIQGHGVTYAPEKPLIGQGGKAATSDAADEVMYGRCMRESDGECVWGRRQRGGEEMELASEKVRAAMKERVCSSHAG